MPENDVKLTKLAKCAGCGAKVGAGVLAQLLDGIQVHRDPNLLVGFDKSDDASVYKVSDDLALVQTVDFFPPIADDPYLFGQIAATNALSDVYAMGGEPKLCLNIMAVPEEMSRDTVHQILRGGYDKVYEAGALITGGHSIFDDEPKYGLAVTGFVRPDRVLTNSGAKPGDVLILTKPLGIGVLTSAAKADMASEEGVALAQRLMTTLNKAARDVMVRHAVHACTDVTGFGLLGHTCEMAQGSDVEVELHVADIDLIPEAVELARSGSFDLIILDLMMPKIDGLQACMRIREFSNVPIIMLTARSEDTDKIIGFECGADDYLTKPFNILELKARVRALLRRAGAAQQQRSGNELAAGHIILNTGERTASRDGVSVELTAKEFDLMELLLRNPGRVYSRENLLNVVWGYEYIGDYRTVDVHVRRLREKLELDPANPEYILTKWGVGYYLKHG